MALMIDGPLGTGTCARAANQRQAIDFIFAGYPKCATTTLAASLAAHPRCLENARGHTGVNEIYYFPGHPHFATGRHESWDWYHSHWDWQAHDVLRFEKTPAYAFDVEGLKMLAAYRREHNEHLKIILSLRDPVDAFESRFAMYRRGAPAQPVTDDDAFHEAGKRLTRLVDFDHPPGSYHELAAVLSRLGHPLISKHLLSYCFALSIRELFRIFPPAQVLVVTSEALRRDGAQVIRRCYDFLGLDALGSPGEPADRNVRPKTQRFTLPVSFSDTLRRFFAPYNRTLADLCGIDEYAASGNQACQAPGTSR